MTDDKAVYASRLRVLEYNARSIGRNPKRNEVLHFLQKKDPDIFVITETKIGKEVETEIRDEWGGEVFFSSLNSHERGVAIFKKKGVPIKIIDQCIEMEGNLLALLLEFEGRQILLQAVYGPNRDDPAFYNNKVFKQINKWNAEFSIFCGDWNVTLDPSIDTKNYLHDDNNLQARNAIISKMAEHNLADVWRILNHDEKKFTWRKPGREIKLARLDFFLISISLLPYVQKASIEPGFCSDHSPTILDIDFSKFQRGKGFYKFNNSLLYDPEYVEKVKQHIKKVAAQYSNDLKILGETIDITPQILDDFFNIQSPESLQELELTINPQLFLDTLLLEIRGLTIKHSSEKKKDRVSRQQMLSHEIEALETNFYNDPNDSISNEDLQRKKTELEDIYK